MTGGVCPSNAAETWGNWLRKEGLQNDTRDDNLREEFGEREQVKSKKKKKGYIKRCCNANAARGLL
jgi:hypothetical protein